MSGAAASKAPSLFQKFYAAMANPETGWKTTHFWGPVANWGLVGAAVYDATFKGPEIIDPSMTGAMIGYSALFMRFAWQVQPRNMLLFSCHTFNVAAQCNQMRRCIEHKLETNPNAKEELMEIGKKAGVAGCVIAALLGSLRPLQVLASKPSTPAFVSNLLKHPAGPMTIFFWAPTSKWMFSVNNLTNLEKDTDTMSFAQMSALTMTGIIWTRYSFVINPVNYNLALVNLCLGASSGYHISRKINNDFIKKKKED